MKLFDRVKEIQNSAMEKRLEKERLLKEDFIKSIEPKIIEAAENGHLLVRLDCSIEPCLAGEALRGQGFKIFEIVNKIITIYFKDTYSTRQDPVETFLRCLL